jgi:hypothetical protein
MALPSETSCPQASDPSGIWAMVSAVTSSGKKKWQNALSDGGRVSSIPGWSVVRQTAGVCAKPPANSGPLLTLPLLTQPLITLQALSGGLPWQWSARLRWRAGPLGHGGGLEKALLCGLCQGQDFVKENCLCISRACALRLGSQQDRPSRIRDVM